MKRTFFNILSILVMFAVLLLAFSCQKVNINDERTIAENLLQFKVSSNSIQVQSKSRMVEFKDENGNAAPFNIVLKEEPSTPSYRVTKGTPIEDVDAFVAQIDSFKVWGYKNTTEIISPNFKEQKVKYFGDDTYCPADADGSFLNYYPLAAIEKPHFYALAPFAPAGTVASLSVPYNYLQFTYTMPEPNTAENRDAEAQQDLLVGILDGTITSSVIPMTFRQPLSRIRFIVGNINKNVTIKSIALRQIASKGTYKLNQDGTSAWSSVGTLKDYTQVFNNNLTAETPKGSDINDENLTKTFLCIPYKYTKETSCIDIIYTDVNGEHTATFTLAGQDWKEGNTYTYSINSFSPSDVYIDFPHYVRNGGGELSNLLYVVNDYFHAKYPQKSRQYEKLEFPILNCVPGTWYALSFHENIVNEPGQPHYNLTTCYGCRVESNIITAIDRESSLCWYGSKTDPQDDTTPTRYIWVCDEGVDRDPYSHPTSKEKPATILFYATAETMYWVWDCSKLYDDYPIDITIHADGIVPVSISTSPTIDYIHASHYGFSHYKDDSNNICSTYKTIASDNSMEFHCRGNYNNKCYPRLNIPLVNLTEGHRYKISFSFERTKGSVGTLSGRYFGYRISADPAGSDGVQTQYTPAEGDNFVDKTSCVSDAHFSFTESFEFTATADTMYWIWEMSSIENERTKPNEMLFTNTMIEEVL